MIQLREETALLSLPLLHRWLLRRLRYPKLTLRIKTCLAEYNPSVLEFATFPNLCLVTQTFDKSLEDNCVDARSEGLQQLQTNLFNLNIDICEILYREVGYLISQI